MLDNPHCDKMQVLNMLDRYVAQSCLPHWFKTSLVWRKIWNNWLPTRSDVKSTCLQVSCSGAICKLILNYNISNGPVTRRLDTSRPIYSITL